MRTRTADPMPALPTPLIKSEFRLESKHYSLCNPHLCKCGDKRALPKSGQGENPAKAGRTSLAGVLCLLILMRVGVGWSQDEARNIRVRAPHSQNAAHVKSVILSPFSGQRISGNV